jgi:uncharacterized membrane protein YidH (DUF202 family)
MAAVATDVKLEKLQPAVSALDQIRSVRFFKRFSNLLRSVLVHVNMLLTYHALTRGSDLL